MALTPEELAELAQACLARASQVHDSARYAEDARAALQHLVDDQFVRTRHRDATKAIRRALAVDLQDPANRKGDIPRALGLAGRASKEKGAQHLAIWMMMTRLHDEGYPSKRAAVEAVIAGFYAIGIGIDRELTADNVDQVWERYQEKMTTRW
jgi:hypothetical protein